MTSYCMLTYHMVDLPPVNICDNLSLLDERIATIAGSCLGVNFLGQCTDLRGVPWRRAFPWDLSVH